MKSRKFQLFSLFAIVLGVVAWAPPAVDDLVMGTNIVASPNGYVAVIGGGNKVNAASSFILGENNRVSHDGNNATTPQGWRMLVVGDSNSSNGGGANTIVGGYHNAVIASNSLVVGEGNNVSGGTIGGPAYDSAAIGANNLLNATYCWAMGINNAVQGNVGVAIGSGNQIGISDQPIVVESVAIGSSNIVSSNYSYAFGGGLRVTQPGSLALGCWNAPMVAGDVMVVGCGNSTTPTTALRVTSNGGVILGRAQGDISMGAYQ